MYEACQKKFQADSAVANAIVPRAGCRVRVWMMNTNNRIFSKVCKDRKPALGHWRAMENLFHSERRPTEGLKNRVCDVEMYQETFVSTIIVCLFF